MAHRDLFSCFYYFLLIGPLVLSSCSSYDKFDTTTPEGSFALAEKYAEDSRYDEAIAQFNAVKNRFPYSKLTPEAELRVADIHFKRDSFVEAQSSYEVFKELHPRHPQSDFVTYRLGLSLFKQLPSTIDRDLAVADRAIIYFDEVIRSFPQSQFVEKAKKFRGEARLKLAQKQLYIGDFYRTRKLCISAVKRYETLIRSFLETEVAPKAFAHLIRCQIEMKDREKALAYLEAMKEQFPKSALTNAVAKELKND